MLDQSSDFFEDGDEDELLRVHVADRSCVTVLLTSDPKGDGGCLWANGDIQEQYELPSKEVMTRALVCVYQTKEDKWAEYAVAKMLEGGEIALGRCEEQVKEWLGYVAEGHDAGGSVALTTCERDSHMFADGGEAFDLKEPIHTLAVGYDRRRELWIPGAIRSYVPGENEVLFLADEGMALLVETTSTKTEVYQVAERVEVFEDNEWNPGVIERLRKSIGATRMR